VRVYVTGGYGMLGTRVVNRLSFGNDVYREKHAYLDLVDHFPMLVKSLYLKNPDVVVHCAGVIGGVKANIERPAEFLRENLQMGLNLLEAMKEAGVKRIVNIGTNCSYPDPAKGPIGDWKMREKDLWEGKPHWTHSPYGLAKRMVIEACEAYNRQYGIEHTTLCVANIYGPGATYDPIRSHAIPGMVKKIVDSRNNGYKSVTMWGTGESTRRFLYVEDAARAVEMFVKDKPKDDLINVVGSRRTKIKDLANLIAEKAGYKGEIIWDGTNPDGQWSREVDGSLAHTYGWEERVTLEDGIEAVIEDYERSKTTVLA